ncbi:hypothetical protein [Streptomyces sp. NPDC046727]|uniref:hypothetical protein n=1 Tax=Streptomyces sp. NPDC046727 TaxID=3155373 RepID=UPI00340EE3F6
MPTAARPHEGEQTGEFSTLLAHDARFDYDVLTHEFARARAWLPAAQHLCGSLRSVAGAVEVAAVCGGGVDSHAHERLPTLRFI